MIRIGIVADYQPGFPPHTSIEPALGHAASALNAELEVRWLDTDSILEPAGRAALQQCDGLWAGPGSPYRSLDGMLEAIRFARVEEVPLLGTCGGCQHAILEYARNALGFRDAASAETDPYASQLFLSALVCSPAGRRMLVKLQPGSRAEAFYQSSETTEEYYCNFGLNPAHESTVEEGGLRISGRDQDNEPRIFELPRHRFYVATLFVPQTSSTPARPHPIIRAFVEAAGERRAALDRGGAQATLATPAGRGAD